MLLLGVSKKGSLFISFIRGNNIKKPNIKLIRNNKKKVHMDRKLGMFLNTKHIEVNEGIKKAREWG